MAGNFSPFEKLTRADWEKAAQKITGGKATDEALSTRTYDDIIIKPLYDESDLASVNKDFSAGETSPDLFCHHSFSADNGWEVRQKLVLEESLTSQKITEEFLALKKEGADGVWLEFLELPNKKSIKKIISEAENIGLSLFIDAGPYEFEVAQAVLEQLEKSKPRNTKDNSVENSKTDLKTSSKISPKINSKTNSKISLNLDPLGTLARYGQITKNPEELLEIWAEIAKKAYIYNADIYNAENTHIYNVIPFGVDVSIYAEAGATESRQLSLALKTAKQYIDALLTDSTDFADEPNIEKYLQFVPLEFTFAVSPEMFRNIAFLRAFRVCFSKLLQEEGIAKESADTLAGETQVHAVSSSFYFTGIDIWNNLLRSTSACFGAVLGGANSVTVLPIDTVLESENPAYRRLAANVSHLLKRESHLARVGDPASGSFYLESLTAEMAKQGWGEFKELAEGDMFSYLKNGKIHKAIEDDWQNQLSDISNDRGDTDDNSTSNGTASNGRKEKIIVGVNKFQDATSQSNGGAQNESSKAKQGSSAKQAKSRQQFELPQNPAIRIDPLQPKRRSKHLEK